MLDNLFGNLPIIQKSLQGLTARQRTIGENVANSDTPGYKRLEVAYESQLRAAMKGAEAPPEDELPLKTESARHYQLGPFGNVDDLQPNVFRVAQESSRNDRNNVDVELEMSNLAETNIRYNSMATLARQKFEGWKTVLREIR